MALIQAGWFSTGGWLRKPKSLNTQPHLPRFRKEFPRRKMQPNQIQNGPVFDGSYVPYFYQSGRFLHYDLPHESARYRTFSSQHSRYDFSADLSTWPPSKRPQTVEQIISNGYFSIPGGEPETAIISDKKETSWLGLDDIIGQIRNRYRIYEKNIYEIELGKCHAISSLLTLEAERGGVRADGRETYSLSKSLREFYEAQRDERVTLWQDISKLRQTLPESAQNYLAAYRKVAILEDDKGDMS
jgi:hypothetical protein